MTLREEKFARLMERFQESCEIYKIPAPGLVELIEQGKADSPETDALLRTLFAPYPPLDALVLGCTHYPFAAASVARVLGREAALLDGGDGTARETKRRLEQAGLLRSGDGSVTIENSSNDPQLIALSMELLEEN
jgi:glutamate racemase